jgi:hypothetical protein
MKNVKSFLGFSFVLVFATLLMGMGSYSTPAMAAGEPAAQLETYPLEAEGAAVCTPDAAGMVAYWPFDDAPAATTFVDVIENPAFNNGTCTGNSCPTQTNMGKVNSAFSFDVVALEEDEVRVTDTSGLGFTVAGDITIETWVKTTQDCSSRSVFIGRYEGDSAAAWWLGCIEGNVAAFHMRDSNNQATTIASTTVINDGEWHHIVGTRDGSENSNKIYVDGALENSSTPTFTGELTFNAKDVTIGFFDVLPFYWFNGTLDEMALYNQALPADEVARHYLGGEGQSYCNSDLPIPGGITFQTNKNTPFQFTANELMANDVAPDGGLELVSIDPNSTNGGTITGSNPYTYTPPTDFTGDDTFDYVIRDVDNDQATGGATVKVVVPGQSKAYLPVLFKNISQ